MQDLASVLANRQEWDRLIKSVWVHQKWIDSLKFCSKFKILFIHSTSLLGLQDNNHFQYRVVIMVLK